MNVKLLSTINWQFIPSPKEWEYCKNRSCGEDTPHGKMSQEVQTIVKLVFPSKTINDYESS